MKDRPDGVADASLLAALAAGWGVTALTVTYLPVGAGSHHWSVVDDSGCGWFATVDDLDDDDRVREDAFRALRQALDTALALRRDAGLGFVVAAAPTRDGATVWRLDSRYALSVYPVVDGRAGDFGAHRPEDLPGVVEVLAELHRATPAVVTTAPRADLVLPRRQRLERALGDLDRPWTGGPYAEPARRLLAGRTDHVGRLLARFDRLVAAVRARSGDWVVTHGEPHPGNVMRDGDRLYLIDWDTVQLAPPERDLWMIAEGHEEVLAWYTEATGRAVDRDVLALYELWWELADIACFVRDLRRPHTAAGDGEASWTWLRRYLEPSSS